MRQIVVQKLFFKLLMIVAVDPVLHDRFECFESTRGQNVIGRIHKIPVGIHQGSVEIKHDRPDFMISF